MNQALDEAAYLGFPKIEEKHLKKAERLLPSSTRTHCLVLGKVEATRAITPVAWATDDACQLKNIRKVKPMWHFFSATNLMDLQSYSKRMAEESKEVTMYIAFRGTALVVQTKESQQEVVLQIRPWDTFESGII